jgi:hypothetical protein
LALLFLFQTVVAFVACYAPLPRFDLIKTRYLLVFIGF